MKLIVGLGNPGEKYEITRHNAGFLAIDKIKNRWNFDDFKKESKFKAEITSGIYNDEKIFLAKPQTYMNLSGESVNSILNYYKLTTKDLIVIHDDIDLPIGKIRIKKESSAGGHNGIKSIIQHLGTQDFSRIKIGIESRSERRADTSDFVLGKFSSNDFKIMEECFIDVLDIIELIIGEGIEKAKSMWN